MANPIPTFRNSSTRMLTGPVQAVSDTKFSTKTLAAGVAPAQTDFFTSAPSSDATLDWYDAGNQLVTSAKQFCIQAISVNVIGTAIADVDAIVQKGIIVLTAQGKEIGRFRVRHLAAAGGTFVAGSQVAAASTVGVVNGTPQTDIWRVADLLIDTNQSLKASLWMPTATTYTITASTNVEIDLVGYEIRPAA